MLKSTLFGGFEKESSENFLKQLVTAVNQLEMQLGMPLTKFDASMLKKTKIGSGYEKSSVLNYLDFLNGRIQELEEIEKQ